MYINEVILGLSKKKKSVEDDIHMHDELNHLQMKVRWAIKPRERQQEDNSSPTQIMPSFIN